MAKSVVLGLFLILAALLASSHASTNSFDFTRDSFPPDFIFGTASSAYQYEGAWNLDGKGPSIWDNFTHKYPEKIVGGGNGDVAIDSYHRYKEDVFLIKETGLQAYRFSISWSRVLPKGNLAGGVNQAGLKYYSDLIDDILSRGLQPFVTLFHWDVPQGLEDAYGGLLGPRFVEDFKDYAEVCYKALGHKVKHWITLNEPYSLCSAAYASGVLAPGRCSASFNPNCTGGNSATEPYIVGHHLLLAHAKAARLYQQVYKPTYKGTVGIALNSYWLLPYSYSKNDIAAQQRALDFMYGWFIDPITFGDYPESMRTIVGNRLPKFTPEESRMLKGSYEFLGINYYTSSYAQHTPPSNGPPSYLTDFQANFLTERNGVPIGPKGGSAWFYIYPKGIRDLLVYTAKKYNNPLIYITENGLDEPNNSSLTLEQALADHMRIDYYYTHLRYVQKAISEGVNVKGYFAWSFLDNFEWSEGFSQRFGLYFVDYKNGLKRHPKLSVRWWMNFLKVSKHQP